ncbi:MAG: DUF4136 domain-containing protein [Gammaproteobacteria bacterium]|nr:DUF4136 domain-containing protein [Gammaproteobacteria bacterium]MDH5303112.1 DUF4136 domain-containing protein [Gammaproteobacteria bacterium]MDH5323144.1 DUF4136 domain-containing protein [Gammaproteobacteria bacterium]
MNHRFVLRSWALLFVSCASAIAVLVGCSTISTGAHYDETTNFGAYKTFSWIGASPYVTAANDSEPAVSPLTRSKIEAALRAGLEAKGYQFVEQDGQADFVLAYTIGTRQEISIDSYPAPYYGAWGWHVRGSHYYVNEVSAHSYTRGTLGVDIFDADSKQPVWHGWAEKTITDDDRKDPSAAINAAVTKLLEAFPK